MSETDDSTTVAGKLIKTDDSQQPSRDVSSTEDQKHNWNVRKRRIHFLAVQEANCKRSLQKMEPFIAKMDHKAICYDISNIMMTVMMVAGNSNVENKFRGRQVFIA